MLLAHLDGGVQAAYDEAAINFRPRYFAITHHLIAHGEAGVGELADVLGVSQPAATQTIGEMRAAGLVSLAAGPDRRTRLIRLTPEALALVERMQPIWDATARAAADLDDALPAPLGAVLDAALAALGDTSFERRITHQMEEI